MNGFRVCELLLAAACLIGCDGPDATGVETHDFKAQLQLPDGDLKLQFFRNAKLTEQTVIPADRMVSANAIMSTHYGEPHLGPWCIVDTHINPSTGMIVAWNPEYNTTYVSPGHTWGMISSHRGAALATIFRPHFGTPQPLDASETLYVNEVELQQMPAYNWRTEGFSADGVMFKGVSQMDDPVSAWLKFSGQWRSAPGELYDIFYLYFDLQMHTRHKNIRGVHRVFFVRDKKVCWSQSCSDEIVVQDNKLLEKNAHVGFSPWPDTPKSIEK